MLQQEEKIKMRMGERNNNFLRSEMITHIGQGKGKSMRVLTSNTNFSVCMCVCLRACAICHFSQTWGTRLDHKQLLNSDLLSCKHTRTTHTQTHVSISQQLFRDEQHWHCWSFSFCLQLNLFSVSLPPYLPISFWVTFPDENVFIFCGAEYNMGGRGAGKKGRNWK